MNKKLLFFLFIIISHFVIAQRTTITGKIYDQLGNVINAHIVNKTSNEGTFSNDEGTFNILVALNDVLEISSIQHHSKSITIASITLKNKELNVRLFMKDYVLDEVEVKKTDLLGILNSDSKNIKKSSREEVMENLGLNPYPKKIPHIDKKIHTAMGGQPFKFYGLASTVSVDYIINSFSGRIKKLKQEKKLIEGDKKVKYIKNRFGNYITSELKIDSSNVVRFLYYILSDKDFEVNYNNGELGLIPFLQKQSILFKKDSL